MLELLLSVLLAAVAWSTVWWWIDVIVKVSVGLGAVIFVHELGHFLMAKACGVKVEKFMIGFDIGGYKLSWRWGETVYGIGILPLGGYVKMFGQDDDPAHIAEQMQKSQIDASSSDAVEITGPSGEKYYIDRRSYLAKSVPQRMAIISAGVIMNMIFALIFAVIAYGMGVEYVPSIVSETVPGSPAWQAGLEPGDEIIKLGDRENPTFMQLMGSVTLGDLEQGIPCLVRRSADGEVVPVALKPTQQAGELAKVGIAGPLTVTLRESEPVVDGSAAARARLVAPAANAIEGKARLQGGDTIVRVNEDEIENYRDLAAALAKNPDETLVIRVRRPVKKPDDDPESGAVVHAEESEILRFEVEAQRLRDFGLVMEMGPITAVQKDSPGAIAGMLVGDVILQVDGKPITDRSSAAEGWDPITLPQYLHEAAMEGREVEFVVQRESRNKPGGDPMTIRVKPTIPTVVHSEIPLGAPMAADAVGIAYRIENDVHSVVPSGPAGTTGIASGYKIMKATIIFPEDKKGTKRDDIQVDLGPDDPNWPALVDALQFAPADVKVEFVVQRDAKSKPREITILPQPVDGFYIAPRGFLFQPITRTRTAETFSEQVRYGWEETVDALTMVFRFLQKLGGQVPITMLGGPGTIAVAAGGAASQGLSSLLVFLTMLSANLAVINFLPIPLLDGGHMVFLMYEGIRGRPANERVVLALHMAGFVFIIGLMLFVIGLDIQRWILT
jgi:regulator of sigma E protease